MGLLCCAVTVILSIMTSSILLIYQNEDYKIRSSHDIVGQKTGYIDGHDIAKNAIEKYGGIPISYPDLDSVATAIDNGDVEFAAVDKIIFRDFLFRHSHFNIGLTSIRLTYGVFTFGIAKSDQNEAVLEAINLELHQMRSEHITKNICSKYLHTEDSMDCF